jgi:FkbM family methyltransferase
MTTAAHLGPLGWLIVATGRFAPTRRLALKMMLWMRAADRLPRFVVGTVNGRRIRLDLDEPVDAKLYVFGAFDARGLKLMARIMRAIQCRTALDIGANIGNHTAFFCDWASRVIAFEPNPPIFRRLTGLVADNRLSNVTPVGMGLSDAESELNFYTVQGAAGMSSLEAGGGGVFAGKVAVTRGDTYLREKQIVDVDFMKIDVEGHEREVLIGLQETITTRRPVILAEYGETSIRKFASAEDLYFLLPGYQIYGTRESLSSRLFKTALSLEAFQFDKPYSHILCAPNDRLEALAKVLRFPDGGARRAHEGVVTT